MLRVHISPKTPTMTRLRSPVKKVGRSIAYQLSRVHYSGYPSENPKCVIDAAARLPLWHRVKAARVPGMTTTNAAQPHPSPFRNSIFGNGLVCILRAGRIIAAIAAQERGHKA